MSLRTARNILSVCFYLLFFGVGGASSQSEDLTAYVRADQDHNGIPDDLELRLANEFAPILFYDADEPNLPTSVPRFLGNTELWYFSEYCRPQRVQVSKLTGAHLPQAVRASCRETGENIDSEGTRSPSKRSTFYLINVPESQRRGGEDPGAWITYVHAYRNDLGGVTLQFWRLYAYNSSYLMGLHIDFGTHGGDWEAIHVVLKPTSASGFIPVLIRLLGHRDIITKPWSDVILEGGHPLILCEKGSHTSVLMTKSDLSKRSRWIEQKSWAGGSVRWPSGKVSSSGPLVLLGQKASPRPGMEWLRYSGLWGTREDSGLYPFYRSGYWGPAFNETGLRKDGFVSAWCEGIAPVKPDSASSEGLVIEKECYAVHVAP
jgi:hypothetical protein